MHIILIITQGYRTNKGKVFAEKNLILLLFAIFAWSHTNILFKNSRKIILILKAGSVCYFGNVFVCKG